MYQKLDILKKKQNFNRKLASAEVGENYHGLDKYVSKMFYWKSNDHKKTPDWKFNRLRETLFFRFFFLLKGVQCATGEKNEFVSRKLHLYYIFTYSLYSRLQIPFQKHNIRNYKIIFQSSSWMFVEIVEGVFCILLMFTYKFISFGQLFSIPCNYFQTLPNCTLYPHTYICS